MQATTWDSLLERVAAAAWSGGPSDAVQGFVAAYSGLGRRGSGRGGGQGGRWWDPSHTFSRDAANLSMELHAGGCFCERLKDGGSVQHLQVVYAAPGQGLRLRGALGPLQTEGVDGTLSWTLKPGEGGTSVALSYVVGGYIRSGTEQWAPRVDRVLDEQLQRPKSFVEGKSPPQ
jgi:hypothetical protein